MRLSRLVMLAIATPALAVAQPAAKPDATKPVPATPTTPDAARPTPQAPTAQQQPTPAEREQAEKQILSQFEGKKNFEIDGKVLVVDQTQGTIVVQREGMPIAFLIVPQSAPIDLNGKKATLGEIQPGAEVRATFNLAQQYPLALKLSATQTGTTPGKQDGTDKQQGTRTQGRSGSQAPATKTPSTNPTPAPTP